MLLTYMGSECVVKVEYRTFLMPVFVRQSRETKYDMCECVSHSLFSLCECIIVSVCVCQTFDSVRVQCACAHTRARVVGAGCRRGLSVSVSVSVSVQATRGTCPSEQ
jgi:hypothetical protein